MKRKFILLFAILLSFSAFAQIEVKPGSFKEVPGFVNVNPDPNYQTDDNELPFAIIKVRTENITDKQRRDLRFEGNAGTFIVLEYKVGEVWVYLTAKYADYLKISHPDFSSIEFTLPYDLKPKCGYELTLVNKWNNPEEEMVEYNYLIVKADQPNAMIYFDDVFVGEKEFTKKYPTGETHKWRIECEYYHPESGETEIVIGYPIVIDKQLKPAFGFINVNSKPKQGATVFIDGEQVGETPYKSDKLKSGQYNVRIVKEKYDMVERKVSVTDGKDMNVNMYMPWKYTFLTLNASISQYNKLSYGLTLGAMKKFGWFVSATTNFSFASSFDYECDADHYVTIDGSTYYPEYTGTERYSSLSVMGGVLMRLGGPVALRAGVGYGMRTKCYETNNGYWVKNSAISTQGIDASLGLQCNFRGFIVSLDCVSTNFKTFEAKIGLGYGLKNK